MSEESIDIPFSTAEEILKYAGDKFDKLLKQGISCSTESLLTKPPSPMIIAVNSYINQRLKT